MSAGPGSDSSPPVRSPSRRGQAAVLQSVDNSTCWLQPAASRHGNPSPGPENAPQLVGTAEPGAAAPAAFAKIDGDRLLTLTCPTVALRHLARGSTPQLLCGTLTFGTAMEAGGEEGAT